MASVDTTYIKAKVRELFPSDDPVVPFLLRLMAAFNDLATLRNIWVYAQSRVGHTQSEKDIIDAEHTNLFRLTCGTLYESALVFQDFRNELAKLEKLGMIGNLPEYAQNAFTTLGSIFSENFIDKTHYGKVLVRVRNSVFHYDQPKVFRRELEKHDELGALILAEAVGVSRYLLADDLQAQIITRPLDSDWETEIPSLGQMVMEVIRYMGALVDGIARFYVSSQESAVVESVHDTVDTEHLWNVRA